MEWGQTGESGTLCSVSLEPLLLLMEKHTAPPVKGGCLKSGLQLNHYSFNVALGRCQTQNQ